MNRLLWSTTSKSMMDQLSKPIPEGESTGLSKVVKSMPLPDRARPTWPFMYSPM